MLEEVAQPEVGHACSHRDRCDDEPKLGEGPERNRLPVIFGYPDYGDVAAKPADCKRPP
jgi:hypothetical protein